MYITIKLPPAFGSFNQLRKENYPFSSLFTSYLAAVSRLGLSLKMDVDELVGYIEDQVFEGKRLPDIPEGEQPVNIRYKVAVPEDADGDCPGAVVKQYIEGSALTNRMAVLYIVRMTLRMSAAYGTSLLRLTRLIADLEGAGMQAKPVAKAKQGPPKARPKAVQAPESKESKADASPFMPKVSARSERVQTVMEEPAPEPSKPVAPSVTAQAAREAVSALAGLAAEADSATSVVETNPLLNDFL